MGSYILNSNISDEIIFSNKDELNDYLLNTLIPYCLFEMKHMDKSLYNTSTTIGESLTLAFSYIIDPKYLDNLRKVRNVVEELKKSPDIMVINELMSKFIKIMKSLKVKLEINILINE